MGYGDPVCYGGTLQQTPNIDRLAREGVRFTDGYVTAAVCGPSRGGLITGTYQQKFGLQANPDGNKYTIPRAHKLMPEAMAMNGYKTGMFGKWNVPHGSRNVREVFTEANGIMDWVGEVPTLLSDARPPVCRLPTRVMCQATFGRMTTALSTA